MLRLKKKTEKEMKIRCDVCDKEEASVFCPSDEAALCSACDRHVHRANKLAGKHTRFSLLLSDSPPLCDICQLRRAFLFCREDRAILCRECDVPIHAANEHTQKHSRFLLTGVKISPPSAAPSSSSTSVAGEEEEEGVEAEIGLFKACSRKRAKKGSNGLLRRPLMEDLRLLMENSEVGESGISDNGVSFSKSSISEYLESLPGWCVEDFLDSSCAADVFCKV